MRTIVIQIPMNTDLTNSTRFRHDLKIGMSLFRSVVIWTFFTGGFLSLLSGDVSIGYYIGGAIGGLIVGLYENGL